MTSRREEGSEEDEHTPRDTLLNINPARTRYQKPKEGSVSVNAGGVCVCVSASKQGKEVNKTI